MGKVFVKTPDGWRSAVPSVRRASGWSRVKTGYRKTASTTWTPFLTVDNTPPAVPLITFFDRVDTKLRLTLRAPASADVTTLVVKVGKRIAGTPEPDSDFLSTPDGTDEAWSLWTVAPGQSRTKNFPMAGSLTNNTLYYVTAWSLDGSHNYSSPVTASAKYVLPVASTSKVRTATIEPSDSTTFRRTTNEYYRDDKYLRLGGTYEDTGVLYYGTRLSTQLKNAKSISKAQVKLQRMNRSQDFTGAAQFHLFAHTMTSYSKVDIDTGGRILYTSGVTLLANKGQSITVDVPDEWLPDLMSGKIKGFGLSSGLGPGNTTDPLRSAFYGDGTASGKVYLEYQE